MLSCTIDAKEGRYVIVTDIPGAFLHADMEDEFHMVLEGTIAKLIVKLDPNCTENISGILRKASQCYMYNLKRHCTVHSRRRYCFGNYCPQHYRSGISQLTGMTNVLQTRL